MISELPTKDLETTTATDLQELWRGVVQSLDGLRQVVSIGEVEVGLAEHHLQHAHVLAVQSHLQ